MAQFNANIKLVAPNPLDDRYLSTRVVAGAQQPYSATTEVNTVIDELYRYTGLTVNVNGVEYWYKEGITDPDLVIKEAGGAGTITGGTNGLSTSGANIILGGDLLSGTTINADNNDFSVTNVDDFQVKTSGDTTILGIDNEGFLLQTSGGTVTFDDGGGLKYLTTGYSSGYTATSIPDVHFVTGQTSAYLKLDQTTPQNVTGSQPSFDEGLQLGATPAASQISGHTAGRMYYDDDWSTVSVDVGTESTLQLSQEVMRYAYNDTGSVIPDGSVVYISGVHSGSVDTVTIALAVASGVTGSQFYAVTTQELGIGGYGLVTVFGNVGNLNTSASSQYSGMTVGAELFLSSSVLGGITNIPPTAPDLRVFVGRLITKDATDGKILVDVYSSLSLNDLNNVSVSAPTLDYVLTWNGVEWVDAAVGSTSAGSGVNFYYATPVINAITPPAGISQDGTSGNGIQVATFSRYPVTTGATITVAGLDGTSTRAFGAWEQDDVIGRTQINSGLWEFYDYVSLDSTAGAIIFV